MRKLALVLAGLFVATSMLGQSGDKAVKAPTLFYVHEEVAKPGMLMQYDQTSKEFATLLKEQAPPWFHFNVFATTDFHYYYVVPIENYSDIDRINDVFKTIGKKMPERMGDLMRRSGASMDHATEWVVRLREDLSYQPAVRRFPESQNGANRFDFYFLQPGMENEVDRIAGAWKKAFTDKKFGDPFFVMVAEMGPDLPVVIVETFGKSAADLEEASMKNMQALGEQAMKLNMDTMALTRRFETKSAVLRADLSNPWPMPAPMK
jgi:hypothetical protein